MPIKPTLVLRDSSTQINQLAARAEAQIEFARLLAKWHPSRSLNNALAAAEAIAEKVFAKPAAVEAGIRQVEEALAPFASLAKQYTIYAIGHAHIDMNWMWGWPETVAVTNDTFTTVLKLMEEFPTFHFSQSQASVYRLIEEYNPALLKQIAQRIKEGRWEVTASHWVEGDRNMVSGESLTRHILYTRKYQQETFGLTPEDVQIDWSPDTFGHPISVPMYLTRGGVKYVYLHRPGAVGPKRPLAFWWQSPDGARVLVRNDMDNGYNGHFTPGVIDVLNRFHDDTGLKFVNFVYGVGDHGGGPTRRDLAAAIDMHSWPIFPNIRFSRAQDFYQRLEKEGGKLPVLKCELNFELAGCYTTQSLIKRSNRIAEHRLLDAEAACTIASAATGRDYPAGQFEQAWRDTLFCHFHDILPGSNVHDSRTWMHGLFQKTIATTSIAETLALRELAAKIDTAVDGLPKAPPAAASSRAVLGAGVGWGSERNMLDQADNSGGGPRAIVIFNPTAFARKEVVEATLWMDTVAWNITDEMRNRPISVRTPDGKLVGAQKLEHGAYWGHGFVRVAFPAQVPSLGYAAYTVIEDSASPAEKDARQITPPYHCSYIMAERRPEGLESDLLRLEIDPLTGGIRSLTNKQDGVSLTGAQPWHLEYALEKPHGMTAWIIDNAVEYGRPEVLAIDRRLDGPYKATVEVRLKIKDSEFTLTYELRAGDPRLYLHLRGTWMERGTPQTGVPSLYFRMDMPLSDIATTYEIPFGTIERDLAQGQEVPSLNMSMVTGKLGGKPAGVLLLNDCKHGHSLLDNVFRLTLIRSAYDPDPLPDVGQHEIHLALMPCARLTASEAIAEGKAFNRPLRLATSSLHDGALPAAASAANVSPATVLLTEVKRSEDGSGLILRLVNPTGKATKATIALNPDLIGKYREAAEVDLMEQPAPAATAKLAGSKVTVTVPAKAIASVKLAGRT